MTTRFRVWDGSKMHYSSDPYITLVIERFGEWSLWYGTNFTEPNRDVKQIACSSDEKSVLMWSKGTVDCDGKAIYDEDYLLSIKGSYIHTQSHPRPAQSDMRVIGNNYEKHNIIKEAQ